MAKIKYDKVSTGALNRAAFHDAMSDVHGAIGYKHIEKSDNAFTSRSQEFHLAAANEHSDLSEYHFKQAKSGTSAGLRSMEAKVMNPDHYAFEIRN